MNAREMQVNTGLTFKQTIMPGTRCAVATCSNSLIQTKKANLPISYHTFPKDLNIFDVWVSACQRGDQWNPKTSVICSQHFEEGDFEVDLRSKLMNIRTKRKLKCNAVPSLFLPKLPQTETSATVKCEQVVKQEEFIVEEVVIKTERIDDDEYSTNVAVEQNVAEIPLTDKELPLNKNSGFFLAGVGVRCLPFENIE
ncbi:hypothetical protein Trydic_g16156 [Trypoxylus dichotomus]